MKTIELAQKDRTNRIKHKWEEIYSLWLKGMFSVTESCIYLQASNISWESLYTCKHIHLMRQSPVYLYAPSVWWDKSPVYRYIYASSVWWDRVLYICMHHLFDETIYLYASSVWWDKSPAYRYICMHHLFDETRVLHTDISVCIICIYVYTCKHHLFGHLYDSSSLPSQIYVMESFRSPTSIQYFLCRTWPAQCN